MNYAKLKLGGKDRGIKLGIGYLKHLTEVYKCPLEDVFAKLNGMQAVLVMPEFIYHSLVLNDNKASRNIDYTVDDVIEWLDEAGGIQSEAWKLFQESFKKSVTIDEEIVEDVKEGKNMPQEVVAQV